MNEIKELLQTLDYKHRELFIKKLNHSERRYLLQHIDENTTQKINQTAKNLFQKLQEAQQSPLNISKKKDHRSIITIIRGKFSSLIDEIAYLFGYFTVRKTQELVNRIFNKIPVDEKINSISGSELEKILTQEKSKDSNKKINLKTVLKNHEYPSVIKSCVFDNPGIFSMMDLEGITFDECKFEWCHFSKSFLKDVKFQSCVFLSTSFLKTTIITSDFYNCSFQQVMFTDAKINQSSFSSCSIIGSSFEDAEMIDITFRNTCLPGTHFLEAYIKDSQFIQCNLKDAFFFGNLNNFFVDKVSKETVITTRASSVILVNPESRGIATPKAYMKLDQTANLIPLRISLSPQKIDSEEMNQEVQAALNEIGSYDRKKLPIPQQLLKIMIENPDKNQQSMKILKKVEKLTKEVDSFFLPGGNEDIPPALYGQKKEEHTNQDKDYRRSILELSIIYSCFNKGIPLMGVCRGFQMTNIFFGAQLLQDVSGHEGIQKFQLVHKKGLYEKAFKKPILSTVYHHQAVSEESGPIEHLEASVVYQNLIKASELKYSGAVPMILLQFHPEFHKAKTADGLEREIIDKVLEVAMSEDNEIFWRTLSDSAKTYYRKKMVLSNLIK